jgi:inorganic pyrophosphatase
LSESDKLEKARQLHYRTTFQGFPISIENRKGSIRRWYDRHTATEGETKMVFPYGYIRLTEGTDGDHVDVFLGQDESAEKVYVVHQRKAPSFKEFDEDKCLLGFPSAKAAKAAYLQHFDRPDFFGGMSTFTVEEFRRKLQERKGEMIKHERAELDRWEKAITAVGLPPERFSLVVKYARLGYPAAREALDSVYAELAKSGEVLPRDRTVGHMSLQSPQPPRGKPSPQVQEDWPLGRGDKPARKKRKRVRAKDKPVPNPQDPNEIVTAQSRFDFRSDSSEGRSNPPHFDRIAGTTRIESRQEGVEAVREGIANQVEQRRKLNESGKPDADEIREIYRQEGS